MMGEKAARPTRRGVPWSPQDLITSCAGSETQSRGSRESGSHAAEQPLVRKAFHVKVASGRPLSLDWDQRVYEPLCPGRGPLRGDRGTGCD